MPELDALWLFLPRSVQLLMPSLVMALACGGAIGMERSAEGRAAGFRTFSLVAMGSALITSPAIHPELWHYLVPKGLPPMDPTRVIQGIVTGVGFLGAGVIYKEGFAIRGLTTAACIWVVSAIGVLMGLGLFEMGVLVTCLVLMVLTLFRRVEAWVPTRTYTHLRVAYSRAEPLTDAQLQDFFRERGFVVKSMGYALDAATELLEFKVTLVSPSNKPVSVLAQALRTDPRVKAFELAGAGD